MSVVPRAGLPGTNYERTFIAIKPDGVQRAKVGNIIARFENKGYKLVGLKMLTPSKEKAEGHYADLSSKPFFGGLVKYFSSGPIVAMVWEGVNAIAQGRTLLGATNPAASAPGTIRGDLCVDIGRNICHGSDGPESAKHEIEFWFNEDEVQCYTSHSHNWVYEKGAPVRPATAPAAADKAPKKKKSNKKKKKSNKNKKPAVDPKVAEKLVKACLKEGGKKGQDIGGMSTFGVHFFLTSMEAPEGDLAMLMKCMEGANKEVDPDAEDRKGGAGDLAKIFFSAGDHNLAMVAHVPKECSEKCSVTEFFNAVIKGTEQEGVKVTQVDEFTQTAEIKGDPDNGVFPLKIRDAAIAAGFNFLREKGLVLDDESEDDTNYAEAAGVNLNAGADGNDY
jgi:nucleoside-diphosphate kinase